MSEPSRRAIWIDNAIAVHRYHINKAKEDESWTLQMTAKNLHKSIGAISEALLVTSWMRTHRIELEKFEYASDALKWIRKKKKEMILREIE